MPERVVQREPEGTKTGVRESNPNDSMTNIVKQLGEMQFEMGSLRNQLNELQKFLNDLPQPNVTQGW